MKKADVEIGGLYAVKVSGKVVPVQVTEEHQGGGWVGVNQETNRQVRIKTAGRLRRRLDSGESADEGTSSEASDPKDRAKEDAQREEKDDGGSKGAKAEKKATPRDTGGDNGKMSGLDAAAKVLAEADEPLNCKAITERAFEAGYWSSDGKTPHATVYSAILREIQNKGDESRFEKVGRGLFARAE